MIIKFLILNKNEEKYINNLIIDKNTKINKNDELIENLNMENNKLQRELKYLKNIRERSIEEQIY